MATFHVLSALLVIALVSLCNASDTGACFRPTAAFTYNDKSYLVDGDKYIEIEDTDSGFKETDTGSLKDEFSFSTDGDVNVDAALVWLPSGSLYFFEGKYVAKYSWFWGSTDEDGDGEAWGSFFMNGLDAGSNVGGNNYYFKGCHFTTELNGEASRSDHIGLPCDVDAAFNHDGKMYVMRGDEYWVVDDKISVSGPHDLTSILELTSTTLCQVVGPAVAVDPYEAAIRAEQKYEEENDCVIVDAAITFDNTVYLFNDDQYITLDDEGNEVSIDGSWRWGGLFGTVNAGVVWSGNNATYFFKGPHYYRYFYNIFGGLSFGPSNNTAWAPFFEQGIGAAGNHQGKSYFFNKCEVALYPAENKTQLLTSSDLNLPCEVDAAFSKGNTLYAIKRNEVWEWKDDADKATGPQPLTSVVKMTSWTACAPEQ